MKAISHSIGLNFIFAADGWFVSQSCKGTYQNGCDSLRGTDVLEIMVRLLLRTSVESFRLMDAGLKPDREPANGNRGGNLCTGFVGI